MTKKAKTAKTTLTIEVRYNPDVTDPESLAVAADRLLETVLSTPEILDEYDNPRFGEFLVACPLYSLTIDGPLFRRQRGLLENLLGAVLRGTPRAPEPDDKELLAGTIELLDAIADQAHDRHGIDCLEPDDERCDCELPGYFCSGVPGIIARMEDGKLAPGAVVNRCDLCQRYPSDEAALEKLRELNLVPP